MKRLTNLKVLLMSCVALFVFIERVPAGAFGNKHALIIGIDGCRPDALIAANTPNLDSLMAGGSWTMDAFSGGILGTSTQQATSSGPAWSSILTGVWTDKHGVTDNSFSGSNFDQYPCFFERLRETHPGAYLASIVNWGPINDYIVTGADSEQTYGSDAAVASAVADLLANGEPDVIFVQLDEVDGAGHSYGYSPDSKKYKKAIETADGDVGTMLNAMENRPNYASEEWQVLVTSDHGGLGTSHGGQSADERTVFIIDYSSTGGGYGEITPGPGITAIPPTATDFLGVTIQPGWGWEDEPFGPVENATNPYPADGAVGVDVIVTLSWNAGASATSHDVYFGTNPNPGPGEFQGNQTQTTFDPGTLLENTTYYWRVDELNGGTVTGDIWNFTTVQAPSLIGHWTFDNTLADSAGSADGTFSQGAPTYVPGKINSAISLDGVDDHVVLGDSSDLNFAGNIDFSVALWVNTSAWDADAAIISNKDWNSGANIGWGIFGGSGTNTWQWNYAAGGSRSDYDPSSPTLNDGMWHHLCVTHDRDGYARFYFDGDYKDKVDISNHTGSVDSGYPTVVGTDGAEGVVWPYWFAGDIDELRIYNYVLTSTEVADLYNTGSGCTPADIHIEAVVCGEVSCGGPNKNGQATVTIYDDCGNPVANALVDGTFSGDFNETFYDVLTDGDGEAVFTTSGCVKKPSFSFTVIDVDHATLPYDSNDDLTTGCSG